ncbi:unnamed protein product [marine sediment metagenome]|uniref:Type II secretion system protein GspI C-terminal domain-containing protein n=1 Tax=marine sediment metagenome TaxID=412755 RepID=X0SRG5_9ZZZZ
MGQQAGMMMLSIGNKFGDARGTREYGFTLVEVMVSVAILAVGLALILQGFAFSLNVLRISQDNLKATLVAENKMAELQLQIKEDRDSFAKGLDEEFESGNMEYTWEVKVEPVEWEIEEISEAHEALNEVSACLSWEEGKRKGNVPVVTYISSYEESD